MSRRRDAAEVRLLAAIHWWCRRQPRVRCALPRGARPGDPVVVVGRGFGTGALEARFGTAVSWAVALSDRLAVALVPPRAGAPLALLRRAARHRQEPDDSSGGGGPTRVLRIDPADGALGVLRDTPIVVRFSRPLAQPGAGSEGLRVAGRGGEVSGRTRLSPDGRVLIWGAERPLAPETPYLIEADGLRDRRGEPVEAHVSGFATGPLCLEDVLV